MAGLFKRDISADHVGVIKQWTAAQPPKGWLICDGSAISRTEYATLFAIIGTTYGAGNGSTTFNIPNAQGVTLKGAGSQLINGREKSAGALGTVQEDQMQLLTGEVTHDRSLTPPYGYLVRENDGQGVFKSGTSRARRITANVNLIGYDLDFDSSGSPNARTSATTDGATRDSSLAVNYIIKY